MGIFAKYSSSGGKVPTVSAQQDSVFKTPNVSVASTGELGGIVSGIDISKKPITDNATKKKLVSTLRTETSPAKRWLQEQAKKEPWTARIFREAIEAIAPPAGEIKEGYGLEGLSDERKEELLAIREMEREKPLTSETGRAISAAFTFNPSVMAYKILTGAIGFDPLAPVLEVSSKLNLPIQKDEMDVVSAAKTVANTMKDIMILHGVIKGGAKGIKTIREKLTPAPKFAKTKVATAEPTAEDLYKSFEKMPQGRITEAVKEIYNKALVGTYLRKFGKEGVELSNRIYDSERYAQLGKAESIFNVEKVIKPLTKAERLNFSDVVEGKAKPISDRVIEATKVWENIRYGIAKKAEAYKLTIVDSQGNERPFAPRDRYIPYKIKETELMKVRRSEAAREKMFRRMVEEGKAKNVANAAHIYNIFIQDHVTKRFGNLERSRENVLPKDMYERDPAAYLPEYISRAFDRLGHAKYLGPKDELANNLIEGIRKTGLNYKTAQDVYDVLTGKKQYNQAIQQVSLFVRAFNNFTKMGLSALTNLADITKPFLRTNVISALRGITDAFRKSGRQFAAKSGNTLSNIRAMERIAGIEGNYSEKFFKLIQFEKVERNLRTVTMNAGRRYAEQLFSKLKSDPKNAYLRRRLIQLDIDVDAALKRGKLIQEDLYRAGFKALRDTQPISSQDLPFYWHHPGSKILTQYKTFAKKQLAFLDEFVFKEVAKGNVKPLLTFIVLSQVVGEPVADLKAFVRGRKRLDGWRRVVDNFLTIGGIGLATDFMSAVQFGSYGGGLLKFIAGPTFTTLDEFVAKLYGANKIKNLTKFGIRQIPIVGSPAAQAIFPTKTTYRAKTIPIAEDIIKLMEK